MAEDFTPDPGDLPYQKTRADEWTGKAFVMIKGGQLNGQALHAPERVIVTQVTGPCPRCGHLLNDEQTQHAITNLAGVGRGLRWPGQPPREPQMPVPELFRVDVTCGCDSAHPGAPAAGSGCGASFRVEVPFKDQS